MSMINVSEFRVPKFWDNEEDDRNFDSGQWNEECLMSVSDLRSYCVCQRCIDLGCYWRCPKLGSCCFCYECTQCWTKDWSLVTATQVSVFIIFLLGIISVIVMYFRICRRSSQAHYSGHTMLQNERHEECISTVSPYRSTELSRDRPPPYNEACSAPPLYSSPYNRVSMLEAPPVYPDTPKLSERIPQSNNPTVTHHI